MTTKLLSVSSIIENYGLTKYIVYQTIKIDPSFPALNLGPKKKFMIDVERFTEWLSRRTAFTTNNTGVPTGSDLLKELRYGKYQ